jgi:hypothetical protein
MPRITIVVSIAICILAPSAFGQAPAPDARERQQRLLKATRLPDRVQAVREKGVPDAEVRDALRAARSKRVHAGDMSDIADEQGKAIDQHGPIENFGAFVQSKLDEGLRGRELAAAIREEHARRGIGKGKKLEGDRSRGQKPSKAAKPNEEGAKADRTGKPRSPQAQEQPERPSKATDPARPAKPARGPKNK